jgi:hypothetical protein
MASSSAVSATSPLGPTGSNSTMVLTNTTPGTGSVLSLPVGKNSRLSVTVEPPLNVTRFKIFPYLIYRLCLKYVISTNTHSKVNYTQHYIGENLGNRF